MEQIKKYKNNRKLTTFVCKKCGQEATKPTNEYNRNEKLNRNNFCSRSCSIKYSNKHRVSIYNKSEENLDRLKKIGNNKRNELTPFTYTLRNIKTRFKEVTIDKKYLKELWEQQKGFCAYTNILLKLPEYKDTIKDFTVRASLDRIDSTKGYIKNNVQWISTSINFMKGTMNNEETKAFLKKISINLSLDRDQTISSSQTEMLDANSGN